MSGHKVLVFETDDRYIVSCNVGCIVPVVSVACNCLHSIPMQALLLRVTVPLLKCFDYCMARYQNAVGYITF